MKNAPDVKSLPKPTYYWHAHFQVWIAREAVPGYPLWVR